MDPNHHDTTKKVVGAAVAGLVMGAVAGILFAPKSGKETREDLSRLGERMRDDITDQLRRLSTFTRETYQEVVNTVVNKYQAAKEVTSEEAEELKGELEKHYDNIKQAVEEEKTHDTTPARDAMDPNDDTVSSS